MTPCSLVLITRFLTYIMTCLQCVDEPYLDRGGHYVNWNEMDSCKKGFVNIVLCSGGWVEEKDMGSELGKGRLEEE